ncbi:MAG TPA: hypothetical protein PKD59_11115 [Miltoncostaeaceae bacterium]|nr:hypothetical protein [Miltoncostaeaceae bacterium]
MSTMPAGDPYGPVYNLLDAISMKHMELAQLVSEYKALIEDLEEGPDPDKVKLARVLPGARYTVSTTFIREAWLKAEAELKLLFPEDQPLP